MTLRLCIYCINSERLFALVLSIRDLKIYCVFHDKRTYRSSLETDVYSISSRMVGNGDVLTSNGNNNDNFFSNYIKEQKKMF